jgi:peptidoglycan/xylan/chitin deacetylase (PgdA/CDA1 family)
VRQPGGRAGGRRRLAAAAASVAAAALTVLPAVLPATAARAAGTPPARSQAGPAARPTVVSLTFDDGDADQLAGARILHSHGLRGTFYIITGAVGTPGYLTLADLHKLAAAGQEIGGHTVSHLDLNQVSQAEARRQVCAGRDILAGWGFRAVSFAYPGGFYTPSLERIVRDCGYSTARAAAGLRSRGCPHCRVAETLPPADPYAIRTPGQLDGRWTLAGLQRLVRGVQHSGGGWLPIIFHHICTTARCDPLSVRASLLDAFARWLVQQRAAGVQVRTVGQVAGGRPRPLVAARPAAPHGVMNPSLESVGVSASVDPSLELPGVPGTFVRCWMPASYGSSMATWTRTHDARTGRWAVRLTVSRYRSGDVKLLQQFDLGGCSLPVTPGRSYQLSNWYQATTRTQYSVYYRDAAGRWRYWTSSPYFPPGRGWARASWRTPPVPAGASGLSFGLAIASDGTLTTDGYQFTPAPPDTAARWAHWVLIGEGLAAAAAVGWGVIRFARRRRGGGQPGGGAAPSAPAEPAAIAWFRARAAADGDQVPGPPDPPAPSSSSR